MVGSINRETLIHKAVGRILPLCAAAGVTLLLADSLSAQNYPNRVIKFIVPLAPSSPIDVIARMIAPALSARLGHPVIVENRPGGGTTIGTRAVAKASPDGYTLLFTGATHTVAPALSKNLGYDPIKDFAAIGSVGRGSWVLVVRPSVPAHSVQELVSYAMANPGKLNWGFGRNAGPHLLGELFISETLIDVNRVPYKTGAEAVPDMLGGRIDMNIGTVENLLPLLQDGKLRAIVTTGELRSSELPEVATMKESGLPKLTKGFWAGLLGPSALPHDIVTKLNADLNAILTTRDLAASLTNFGIEAKGGRPEEFATLIDEEIKAWQTAAKLAGIEPE
ncbi:MAG TPA: tripartite tricarboxylate transporter substrate binding protein [Xanthobacteraceae bacterium]|jgi:tripartite-type tricarboxylate transporter receptor subunit TctC